jgi:hypothetical protein
VNVYKRNNKYPTIVEARTTETIRNWEPQIAGLDVRTGVNY